MLRGVDCATRNGRGSRPRSRGELSEGLALSCGLVAHGLEACAKRSARVAQPFVTASGCVYASCSKAKHARPIVAAFLTRARRGAVPQPTFTGATEAGSHLGSMSEEGSSSRRHSFRAKDHPTSSVATVLAVVVCGGNSVMLERLEPLMRSPRVRPTEEYIVRSTTAPVVQASNRNFGIPYRVLGCKRTEFRRKREVLSSSLKLPRSPRANSRKSGSNARASF